MNAEHTTSEAQRLAAFLDDCLAFGCLKGFQHFELYLRGREELLVRIYHDRHGRSSVPTALNLARGQNRAYLTSRTQRTIISTPPDTPVQPLSPLDRDLVKETSHTAFLIAAYSRYKCPYVWLRSNQERLLEAPDTEQAISADAPIRLESVTNWRHRDIQLVDIVAEITLQTLDPPPENPFAVDHAFFDTLPLEESMLLTGAMVDFLQRLCLRKFSYTERVLEDLRKLQKRHFHDFDEVLAVQSQPLPDLDALAESSTATITTTATSALSDGRASDL
ncbi:hypothetical protein SYNPS1DRAFT_29958 [Syncephalis pseudoplumigaleata]|uniref:DUF7886 domain-containing protein n=1 Tax=Syncephalis pseudoplumigaleata TaxID=1712513 RepID=A0A4P9YWN8_9FUNG|nr:hypothetical protein SYNPS1DRAFT_29958 [Syncephalis pseudoplumigaleata]|eukprot:RKP24275.1 hypothetical protein SYNPS1DRAFT_29958 [Syncephalis pseudoplumigaleata]